MVHIIMEDVLITMKNKLLLLLLLAGGCASTDHHKAVDLMDLYTEQYVHYLNTGKYSDLKESHRTFRKFIKAKQHEYYNNHRGN